MISPYILSFPIVNRINIKNIISHLNIYNLAIYNNTELSKKIKYTNSDKNELSVNKSFHKDKEVHKQFYNDIHQFGINILGGK